MKKSYNKVQDETAELLLPKKIKVSNRRFKSAEEAIKTAIENDNPIYLKHWFGDKKSFDFIINIKTFKETITNDLNLVFYHACKETCSLEVFEFILLNYKPNIRDNDVSILTLFREKQIEKLLCLAKKTHIPTDMVYYYTKLLDEDMINDLYSELPLCQRICINLKKYCE